MYRQRVSENVRCHIVRENVCVKCHSVFTLLGKLSVICYTVGESVCCKRECTLPHCYGECLCTYILKRKRTVTCHPENVFVLTY